MLEKDKSNPECGFLHTSLPDFIFDTTSWTRDAGTFLRECVLYGHLEEACLNLDYLIRSVRTNGQGFYSFPEYFFIGQDGGSGSELDGTCAILIGASILSRYLPADHPTQKRIREFFLCKESPIRFILFRLNEKPLIQGSGEFGGGCFVPGEHINVVQNALAKDTLVSVSRRLAEWGEKAFADECLKGADKIAANLPRYLIDKDGYFIWCLDPETYQPNPEVLGSLYNVGTGLVNGVLAMAADAEGLLLKEKNYYTYQAADKTFEKLYQTPERKYCFDKYGVWTQFDLTRPGCCSPSYGQGYAMQAMILTDRMDMLAKALKFLAEGTYSPIPELKLERKSPYEFYERMYTPYSVEKKMDIEVGCGALNIVNVAEPLKVARMMVGWDFTEEDKLLFVPKLPSNITEYCAKDMLVLCRKETFTVDVTLTGDGQLTLHSDKPVPEICFVWKGKEHSWKNVADIKEKLG